MIMFYEGVFLFSKPKYWTYSKLTVSLWHSWYLWACMEGKYIPLLDLSQENPRGIYCTSEFPSAFHGGNSCVLFCIHNWLICIFKSLIHFLFLIWRHKISFSLYSQGLLLLFLICLSWCLWEEMKGKITLLDYWDKERIIQAERSEENQMKVQRYRRGFPEREAGRFKLHFVLPTSLLNCKGEKAYFHQCPITTIPTGDSWVYDPTKFPLVEVIQ